MLMRPFDKRKEGVQEARKEQDCVPHSQQQWIFSESSINQKKGAKFQRFLDLLCAVALNFWPQPSSRRGVGDLAFCSD